MLNINKIRIKLTILNSVVVLSILICIAAFILVTVNINTTSNIDTELTTSAYTLKRYISSVDPYQPVMPSQETIDEYSVYREKLSASYISYGIYGSGDTCYDQYSSYRLPSDVLAAIRRTPFSTDDRAERIIEETDGIYYIHSYRFEDLNLRVCTTVTVADDGNMRIIQTIYNLNIQQSVTDRLYKALIFAVMLGVTLSLISGYFIAGWSIKPIQQSMRRQNEFIADASHELRTPVTIMKTNLDVVKSEKSSTVASQMEWINSAYRETGHMENLINELLETAKADLNKLVGEFTEINIDELCEISITRFTVAAQKKNIELVYIPSDEPLIVMGDRARLIELLGIILDNAIRYTPAKRNITLETLREGDRARIILSDEGIGISKEDCEKIFDRFYRADKARSRAEGGSGLGLSIAREITLAHKGTIFAESIKGSGSVFTIILPLKES